MGGALFAALLGWVAGAALQLQQAALWPAWAYGLALAVALTVAGVAAWVARGPAPLRRPWACAGLAAATLVAGFAQTGWRAVAYERQAWPTTLEDVDLWVTGVIDGLPQARGGGDADRRFTLRVEQYARIHKDKGRRLGQSPENMALGHGGVEEGDDGVRREPLALPLPEVIQLTWYAQPPGAWRPAAAEPDRPVDAQARGSWPRAGERWSFPVRLRAPHGNVNPHGFDYELWLWGRGVQAVGHVRVTGGLPAPRRIAATLQAPVEQWRERVRDRIEAQVAAQGQSARAAGMLTALVLGDQAAIEPGDWEIVRDTGIAHLVAVSGLHITMFAWLAVGAVGWAWRRSPWLAARLSAPTAAWTVGVVLAAAYAVFSGWGVPAQRTIWMLGMVALLRMAGVQWPRPAVWLAAMALIVAVDPWALAQAGFWLSFVAVGVLFASGPQRSGDVHLAAADALGRPGTGWRQGARWLLLHTRALLREQWLMTVSLLPLTLLLFHQFSIVGIVVNLLAIPLVTFVVLPLAMLGVAWAPLWSLDAWLIDGCLRALAWFAGLPGATWLAAARPPALALLAAAAGVILSLRWPWSWKAAVLPWLLPFALWQWYAPKWGDFRLVALDVGQGQAVVVQTARHVLLYDVGPLYARRGALQVDAGQRVLVPYLQARGLAPDRLVFSHTDADHVGGALAVLARHPATPWLGSVPSRHALQAIPHGQPCVAGERWSWDGVSFRVLHPPRSDDAAMARSPNAQSCVLLVGNGRESVLLPGDIGVAQERALLANWPDDETVQLSGIFMPHHGSRSSSSQALLQATQPRWAVAQAGYRNRYNHPHPEVVARYERLGAEVFQSPHCGAWTWESSDPDRFDCTRIDSARYWRRRPRRGRNQPRRHPGGMTGKNTRPSSSAAGLDIAILSDRSSDHAKVRRNARPRIRSACPLQKLR